MSISTGLGRNAAAAEARLRYAGVFDAELFAQQGAHLLEPVGLRRESCPRIDAIGDPGMRDLYNDRMNAPQKRELGPQRLG